MTIDKGERSSGLTQAQLIRVVNAALHGGVIIGHILGGEVKVVVTTENFSGEAHPKLPEALAVVNKHHAQELYTSLTKLLSPKDLKKLLEGRAGLAPATV